MRASVSGDAIIEHESLLETNALRLAQSVDGLASIPAATSRQRLRSRLQASTAAAPLRSVPLEAAVGEVLLFLSVLVAATITRS